jgi:transcriptional regulator with XRE-family HTH domain
MSAESRAKSIEMAKEMMKEMLLSELRIQEGFSQRQLSAALVVKQPVVSRLESQDDIHISTLKKIINALGGSLEIIAHLPNEDIKITQFSK